MPRRVRPVLPRRAFVASMLGAGRAEAMTESTPRAAEVAVWDGPHPHAGGWFEWRAPTPADADTAAYFDPGQHDVWCEFIGPQGRRLRVTAFWSRDAQGSGWRLRLLPPLAGHWRAVPQVRRSGGAAAALGAPFSFDVASVPARQRVVIDPQHPRHFAFDDGRPFVPVGLNVCWGSGESTLQDYRRWFTRLAAQGGNFARLWMASWSFGIEWKDTGLGDYSRRMDRAAALDAVFELAESLGIQLMLCLLNHGAFTEKNDAEWQHNPYNRALGGPLASPADFVTDERAQQLFEQRVRYIAARWAHSPALHSWEWWNEVNWTPIRNAMLRPWFQRMGRVLDAHDPYRRLRSTSWADRGDATAWAMPELDCAQQHDYTLRDPIAVYADAARDWARDGIAAKPLVPGELGRDPRYDPKAPRPFHADAVHLHNGLWAPLFNGYAATALYWWWDLMVDPLDLWPAYRGVARWLQALHTSGLRLGQHRPHVDTLTGGPARALALAGPRSVLLWVRADLHEAGALLHAWQAETGGHDPSQPWQPRYPAITAARIELQDLALPDGRVSVRWFDAAQGDLVATQAGTVRGGALALECPAFERDVAAITCSCRAP